MQPLEKEILKLIRQENLLESGEKVLIGVSGGPDSMALLHVMAHLAPTLNTTIAAAYVNHGLRPAEAEAERNLVETAAGNLAVKFFSGSIDVQRMAVEQKISVEHAARLLRYDFFEKTAREWGGAKIGVGHTADDQAEELLLRLIRGTARKGLAGMQTLRDGRIIRPLLRTPKNRLLVYLEQNSIRFLLDSSNRENHYLRNRIRNDLLPILADQYNPDIRQTLIRTANILQDEEELLDKIAGHALAGCVSTVPENMELTGDNSRPLGSSTQQQLLIDTGLFNREPGAIRRRVLEKCCWIMGCSPQSRQIEDIMQLTLKGTVGSSLHLSDGLRVTLYKDSLRFAYPLGRGSFRGNISETPGSSFPETTIPGPGIYKFPQLRKKLRVEYNAGKIKNAGNVFPPGEYLDASLFSFPLTLRSPRPGDRFRPRGAPGSKKVSDFLREQKVDLSDRGLAPVLCADESILALPGLRIDHRYRITGKTGRSLKIAWENLD